MIDLPMVRTGGKLTLDPERRKLGCFGPDTWFNCCDCGATFPVINGTIRCNEYSIQRCPWCRPDSEPWRGGRGR